MPIRRWSLWVYDADGEALIRDGEVNESRSWERFAEVFRGTFDSLAAALKAASQQGYHVIVDSCVDSNREHLLTVWPMSRCRHASS